MEGNLKFGELVQITREMVMNDNLEETRRRSEEQAELARRVAEKASETISLNRFVWDLLTRAEGAVVLEYRILTNEEILGAPVGLDELRIHKANRLLQILANEPANERVLHKIRILQLVAKGKANWEIAEMIQQTESAVKKILQRLYLLLQ